MNNEYTELFLSESAEHLQSINDHLLNLEKEPHNISIVGEIFRSAHTLKGMAGTMGFEDLASLTHQMENVLDLIRNQELEVTSEVVDLTFECLEILEQMVNDISEGGDGSSDVSALVSQLEHIEKGNSKSLNKLETNPKEKTVSHLTLDEYQLTVVNQANEQGYQAYEVVVQLSEECLLKQARVFMAFKVFEEFGEVIKSVPTLEELEQEQFEQEFSVVLITKEEPNILHTNLMKVSEIEKADFSNYTNLIETKNEQVHKPTNNSDKTVNSNAKSSKTIRVNIERIDYLMNLFEEMVIDRGLLEDLSKKINNNELTETVERMSRVSKDMQNLMLTMRMVPVEQVFNRFPRMVRGLAKELGKRINLDIKGADTELDRTVIDEIGDPLVHLIRNSIDHGIETPEKRKGNGKPEEGQLSLRAYHSGNFVFIEIEDNGAGINREKVIEKAVKNDLITTDESKQLTDEEVYHLIFSSGFSTAEQVSDISGRGVGLDVVKNKIESLGGHILVESKPNQGSKFSIKLPLTLSILSTLLVNVQRETYAIPLSSIEETMSLTRNQIMHVKGQPVIDFRGNVIPLVSLRDVFEVPHEQGLNSKEMAVVIVKKGKKMTGLIIDSFMGHKEVVLKSLGDYFKELHAISGATILGDGSISLILDPNALIE